MYICKLKKTMRFYFKILIISLFAVAFAFKAGAVGVQSSEKNALDLSCTSASPIVNDSIKSQDNPKDKKPKKEKKDGQKKKKKRGKKGEKVTFETFEENYVKACDFYDRHLYISAAKIFEELYPLSMGTPYADTILFTFADCYFQNKDYEMAAFHYKEYANRYTGSPRAEIAHFNAIKAISHLSPEYSLDQTETYYAIEEINTFIRNYPNSDKMAECNALLDQMRDKLALKAFEILKLYYNTENYKAAQISARNFLKEYSSSQYADDAYVILVKNNYDFANKSVESKKAERYTDCLDAFESMKINYPYSRHIAELQKIADDAKAKLQKVNNKVESKKSKKKEK